MKTYIYVVYNIKIQLNHNFFVFQLHIFTLSRFPIYMNMFSRKISITPSVNVREVDQPTLSFQFNIWSSISKPLL